MFTVKAEVNTQTGPTTFQLYQAASVHVRKSTMNGANAPGQPAYIPPDLEVELQDDHGHYLRTLCVGGGLDHYCAVYVMNERGKTVESIYPGPRAIGGSTSIAA